MTTIFSRARPTIHRCTETKLLHDYATYLPKRRFVLDDTRPTADCRCRWKAHTGRNIVVAVAGLAAMTDFSSERPVIVSPKRHMMISGIRALLVVNETTVLGLITAADILGPRPIQFLQNPLCEGSPCRRRDVHVADIMTPWPTLVDRSDIEREHSHPGLPSGLRIELHHHYRSFARGPAE